jgi:hypothetical protein
VVAPFELHHLAIYFGVLGFFPAQMKKIGVARSTERMRVMRRKKFVYLTDRN